MRTKLPLPLTLSFTVLSACAPRDGGDAAAPIDARADVLDDRADDALSDLVDAPTTDAAADFTDACYYNTALEAYGLSCRRRADAPATATCPRRVCQPAECPSATCRACDYTFPCVADDGGAPCVEEGVCDDTTCPSGCHLV